MLKNIRCFTVFALFCFCSFSLNAKAQDKTDEDVIKVDTNLVTVPVIVSDRQNRYIAGLKAENFTVFKDGQKQNIEYFIAEESPINVAILLDTSRSTEQVLDKIQKAALEFVKQLKPNDRCLIISFDFEVNVLSELTNDREKLKKTIKNAEIGERFGTVLHDAVYQAVNKSFAGVKGRKAVILLTDGKDFGSFTGRDELLYKLEESDTLVYSIFYETGLMRRRMMPRRFPNPNRRGGGGGGIWRRGRNPDVVRSRTERSNEDAVDFLQEMADLTAGRLYQKKVTDLSEAFEAITEELRKQYLIGFYPENVEGGKNYQIKVRVDRNDAVVRSKNAFRVKGN
ncbi:MAG TPA: VWA domain-containing protein [Pyrinomonadaceae bacterium]|jgi:VWFA-related protein|nr:VWA domain-containing protein [Pyrinomonadaceae bacterium]